MRRLVLQQARQSPGGGFQQGHPVAPAGQGLGGLQAHGAGPHHRHRPAPVKPPVQALPVGQIPQGEDPLQVGAGKVEEPGPGPGGDEQAVEGQAVPGGELHLMRLRVNPDYFFAQPGLEVQPNKKILLPEPEAVRGDLPAQQVGEQRPAVGPVRLVADEGDGAAGVISPQGFRGLQPRGAGADDHVAHV